ncbi:hypothetical protein TRFO_17608 [Tritrichomonas foetus]|uniref:Uncharacterized protein n=1 Tax=Tritrichomonas foetus TaxID=1144522 RepID=A0A1J4KSL9_9EUKA|nr:hypothetical protein TRFO_17608 [Tritrichomonas foetus]|eukprot:OHT12469.1 hypothetical protein TRFO_17608 [Tritrichomonas foetus]
MKKNTPTKHRSKSIPNNWIPEPKHRRPSHLIRQRSPPGTSSTRRSYLKVAKSKPKELPNTDAQHFNSIIQSLNILIRDLFLPASILSDFTKYSEKINQVGISTIKSKSEPTQFMELWNEFVEAFQKYSSIKPKERLISFFESSIQLLNKIIDQVASHPPSNLNSLHQFNNSCSQIRLEVETLSNFLLNSDDFSSILNQLSLFNQKINETKFFKLAILSMKKREAFQFEIKHTIERINKSLENYQNKDALIFKAIDKINSFNTSFNQLFYPTSKNVGDSLQTQSLSNIPPIEHSTNYANNNTNNNGANQNSEEKTDNKLRNARKENRMFKKKLEIALKEEEKISKELKLKEDLLDNSRKELKLLKPTKTETLAVSKRNDARKVKKELQNEVDKLRIEIPQLEEKLRLKKDEHLKFLSITRELEEVTKDNEFNKSLKIIHTKYLNKIDKNADIKKLQIQLSKLNKEYDELLNKRKNPSFLYFDAQRFQHENQKLQNELQAVQLKHISLLKDSDCDNYFISMIQTSKKEIKELKHTQNNQKQRQIELIPRDFDPIQKLIDQRSHLQKEYFILQKGTQEETKNRRREIRAELSKLPEIPTEYNRLVETLENLEIARNQTKKAIEAETAAIQYFNESVFQKNESQNNLEIKKRRLEQFHVQFEYEQENMNRLRKSVEERVEISEKLRIIETKFMNLFGDRIPSKTTMTLPEKIELVTRQFDKKK